jgi:hypothetical protein
MQCRNRGAHSPPRQAMTNLACIGPAVVHGKDSQINFFGLVRPPVPRCHFCTHAAPSPPGTSHYQPAFACRINFAARLRPVEEKGGTPQRHAVATSYVHPTSLRVPAQHFLDDVPSLRPTIPTATSKPRISTSTCSFCTLREPGRHQWTVSSRQADYCLA